MLVVLKTSLVSEYFSSIFDPNSYVIHSCIEVVFLHLCIKYFNTFCFFLYKSTVTLLPLYSMSILTTSKPNPSFLLNFHQRYDSALVTRFFSYYMHAQASRVMRSAWCLYKSESAVALPMLRSPPTNTNLQ